METENVYAIENNKIIYGNSLISVYDGFVINEAGLYEDKSGQYRASKTVGYLYHESWEALMPVLKKIAAVDYIYCAGICAIIRQNNFDILPIWESVVKHIEFINRKTISSKQRDDGFFDVGETVNFKGDTNFKAITDTFVIAMNPHLMLTYYIEHPDGDITKETMKNSRLGDGFEQPHSDNFEEGERYICVLPNQLEKIK